MPSAHEILLQLKIDDFDALKHKLTVAINNISYIPFRLKTQSVLNGIDLNTHLGQLDLAVLACVLNEQLWFEEKIQMQDASLNIDEYLKPLLSHKIFTRIFNEDIDMISEADTLPTELTDTTIVRQPTLLESMGARAKRVAFQTKSNVNAALDTIATEPHCVGAFTLISHGQKQVSRGLQGAASWVSDQVSTVANEIDNAMLKKFQGMLFHHEPTRNYPCSRNTDWQPPLP